MLSFPVGDVVVGLYLGLLASLFPALVAFLIGFGFKYFTSITVPGLGVVVLGAALAGVSGGLMGLVDPQLSESATGVTAVLVILMACLWAHGQGDKLGAATPRRLTLSSLRETKLSADIAERVDSYGQIRIRPVGGIQDIEGYPPLSDDLRQQLAGGSWRFPADLSITELETRLEDRLVADHELADASVTIDTNGRAQIAAAPSNAGFSRRVPPGKRAVTIETLLPTRLARGDIVTIRLPDGDVTGPVLSARTHDVEAATPAPDAGTDGDDATDDAALPPRAPTTVGGEGQITVALSLDEARQVVRVPSAPVVVRSRGKQREYEVIGVLKQHGNRFRKLRLGPESPLVDTTIGEANVRDSYGVAILAVRRPGERILAPRGQTQLRADDTLIAVGSRDNLGRFEEAVA